MTAPALGGGGATESQALPPPRVSISSNVALRPRSAYDDPRGGQRSAVSSPRSDAVREVLSARTDRRGRGGGGLPGGRVRAAGVPAHAGDQADARAPLGGQRLRQDVHRRGEALRPPLAS